MLRLAPDIQQTRPGSAMDPPLHEVAGFDVVVFNPPRRLRRWLRERQTSTFGVEVWSPAPAGPEWAWFALDRMVIQEFVVPAGEPPQVRGRVAAGDDGVFYTMRLTTEEPRRPAFTSDLPGL